MLKNKSINAVKQFDKAAKSLAKIPFMTNGCINNIRRLLNMSMAQLAKRVAISKQAISAMEKREKAGTVRLKTLKKMANVFGMDLKYAFVPRTSLEQVVEKRAAVKAREIVRRSHQNMRLENQEVSERELKAQIILLKNDLKNNLSSILWDSK
ncbi:MAG: helix-turn-helix domain-containing protein [Bacteroidota bacterium]